MNEITLEKFELKEENPNYKTFTDMLESYLDETSSYSRRMSSIQERGLKIDEVFLDSIYTQEVECYMIRLDSVAIGFAIIGIGSNKHPDSDFFIAEFFVKKEYRNMGYGSFAFCELVNNFYSEHTQDNTGRICLICIEKNKIAMKFWKSVFEKLGCRNITDKYEESVVCMPEDCRNYMYQIEK